MLARLPIAALALALAAATGCASEREIEGWNDDTYRQFPDDAVRIGDFWVHDAAMTGTIADDTFEGSARALTFSDPYGNSALELAMPTERGAVMHLIEFESGTLDAMAPGDTLSYQSTQETGIAPRACAGAQMDAWEVDMPIESVDMTMTENEDGTRNLDWTLVNRTSELSDETETSTGQLLLSDSPFES
jgi:hypothetical protein